MSFKDYFSSDSSGYAAARLSYPLALFDKLAQLAPARSRVWDCATGTGQVAIALAEHFDCVLASDASAQQIQHAEAHPKVEYSIQCAEHTDYPDRIFDLVTVGQALHWFKLDDFYTELDRVLNPGGIFAAFGYNFFDISESIDQALRRHLYEPIEPFWPKENRLLWDGYRNLPFPFTELPAPRLVIEAHWTLEGMLAYLGTWSATRRYLQQVDDDLLDNLRTHLQVLWPANTVHCTSMDLVLRISRKAR